MGTRWQRGAPHLKSFNGKNLWIRWQDPHSVCECITNGESCLTDIKQPLFLGSSYLRPRVTVLFSTLQLATFHFPFKCTDSFRKLSGYSALSIVHCSTPFSPQMSLMFIFYSISSMHFTIHFPLTLSS